MLFVSTAKVLAKLETAREVMVRSSAAVACLVENTLKLTEIKKQIPQLVAKIQARWRGRMARIYVDHLRAAIAIKRAFKRYKVTDWVDFFYF